MSVPSSELAPPSECAGDGGSQLGRLERKPGTLYTLCMHGKDKQVRDARKTDIILLFLGLCAIEESGYMAGRGIIEWRQDQPIYHNNTAWR